MKWHFSDGTAGFEKYRKEWDALNREHSGNHILLDSRFVSALIRHFSDKGLVIASSGQGERDGLVLLTHIGIGSWMTFQPAQAPIGLAVFRLHDDNGYQRLSDLVRTLPGYAVLVGILQQDPAYSAFTSTPNRKNIELMSYIETARLELVGTFPEYWQARSKNLRHNLDRQIRRLKEQGRTLELLVKTEPGAMADCIREYARLESAGWKAAGGTAIAEDNSQGRFYREVFEDFAGTGEAIAFQLVLDGAIVASDLCLYRDGMLVVLKTTYDEKVEKLSPALLMRREILQYLYSEPRFRVIEFYGPVREWHTQWMTGKRTMFHLNIFRHPYMIQTRRLLKRLR